MKDVLDTTYEICKLVKKSPRRDCVFEKLKQELAPDSPGLRVLCPTRWTVRADAFKSMMDNYQVLQETWITGIEIVKDTEMKCRLLGVSSQMKTFNYFFGVMLGQLVLVHCDNLSRTLQKRNVSAAEGQMVANLTVQTLEKIRSEENFKLFLGEKVNFYRSNLEVSDPVLPRQRKVPRRLEPGCAEADYPASPLDHYRRIYFEALDLIVSSIKSRFEQPGYQNYRHLQDLLLNVARHREYRPDFDFVTQFYGNDLSPALLDAQLQVFATKFEENSGT